jgi:hypothetical protein
MNVQDIITLLDSPGFQHLVYSIGVILVLCAIFRSK